MGVTYCVNDKTQPTGQHAVQPVGGNDMLSDRKSLSVYLSLKKILLLAAVAAAATAFASPVLAQKAKDTLRFPILDGETILDQYLSPGAFHYTWGPAVYDSLVGFDPKKGEFLPFLAKSWSQPSPTTYEYVLREDIKWHDGQAFDADDVVYTLNYLTDPKVNLRYKAQWTWIQSVEKLGAYKVRITAKKPVADGLMWMSNSTTIFPEHLHAPLENKQDFGARPIGTGPYKVTKLDKNAGIFLDKNPNFVATPAKSAATIGKVIGEPIPDAGTLVAALLVGKADLAFDVPVDQAAELRASGRFESTLAPAAVAYSFVGFPTAAWPNAKPITDPRVRLAIAMAIDTKALIDVQYGELGRSIKPSDGLCSKEQLGCGFTKLKPAYDPAGAKKLLAEAGYADGFDIIISTHPTSVVPATAVSGMLRAVGIRASVQPHQIVQRVQLVNSGKVQIGFYGWSGGALFETSGNIVRHVGSKEYDDPTLTEMANATFGIMNDAERRKEVAKVFDYIHDKAYAFPMVPLRSIYTHTKEVKLDVTDEIRESQLPSVHEFAWK